MVFQEPKENEKDIYNSLVTHALQSWEWGEFRETTGVKVIRRIGFEKKKPIYAFQLTIHKIPRTNYTIGYLPRGLAPNKEVLEELRKIGKEQLCVFIKLEPNVEKGSNLDILNELRLSPHPMFTDHAFQLNLTKSEEELLKNMHSKTRYNIRIAQKHGVEIVEDNSDEAFENYVQLMHETTKRQQYYAHGENYHRKMWKALKPTIAHLFLAKYKGEVLAAWVLFVFNKTLYYPYGTSSREHREVMASNLLMWEAIKFGKKMDCAMFDMWGSLGENPDPKHPWYGFHKFKEGYGPRLVTFVGSYDLLLNSPFYQLYNIGNKLRWLYLRAKSKS